MPIIMILLLMVLPAPASLRTKLASFGGHVASTFGAAGVTITTTMLPAAKAGVPYSFQWTASGGKKPYKWTITSPLPVGVSLAGNGVMSGTPQAAGMSYIHVKVATANQVFVTKTALLLVITPAGTPLVVACNSPQFTKLANGICQINGPNLDGSFSVGVSMNVQLQATGGASMAAPVVTAPLGGPAPPTHSPIGSPQEREFYQTHPRPTSQRP